MAKIRGDDFGQSRPKVTPEDLDGNDVVIVQIVEVEEVAVDDSDQPTGKRRSLLLRFNETGDKALWLNKTQIEYLIEGLGDDTDDWTGKKVPIEIGKIDWGKQKGQHKVYVSAPESWAGIFREAGETMPKRAGAVRRVASPGGNAGTAKMNPNNRAAPKKKKR